MDDNIARAANGRIPSLRDPIDDEVASLRETERRWGETWRAGNLR